MKQVMKVSILMQMLVAFLRGGRKEIQESQVRLQQNGLI
jgi:hypothetical protein